MENFAGRLYYDESDEDEHLNISDFILREEDISFELTSVSGTNGRWRTAGVAKPVGGRFVATCLVASQHSVPAANPWNLEFTVEHLDHSIVFVEGHLEEGGVRLPFSGDLERKN